VVPVFIVAKNASSPTPPTLVTVPIVDDFVRL
jgi:hypothetical protein